MQRLSRNFAATLLVVLVALGVQVMRAQADDNPQPPKLRLPADVAAPLRYRAELTVVPDQDDFTGTVVIDLHFAKSTSLLWLNAESLTVKEATLETSTGQAEARIITTPKDYIGFAFAHPVGPGEAKLRVSYRGEINRKDNHGIFQAKDGDRWYIYTQFEEIAARRAFPCFDEPGYKVPWQLTLHVKKDHVAVSNTPIVSEDDTHDTMKTVKFAETRPLPSYLIAFSVGDFDVVDAGTAGKKNTRVRIVVPHGRAEEAAYAAQTTPAIVGRLEDYFGIPYPYEKLDEVAVPRFGEAMENAGQVTYAASVMLAKREQDTPERQRQWVSFASHELAHQWFGDLVTNAWWDDIWLNEGFASWMSDKITNEYHPEWKWNVGAVNGTQGAMWNDGLVSARRVRQPIESTNDISNAFDQITYDKGEALLTMFESYMGADRFREGVRRYLERYSWKNATSADFLAALAGDNPAIASAFSTFLDQPGFPLITLSLDCTQKPAAVEFTQQRFLPLGSSGGAPQLWKVPVCVRYPAATGDARECLLLGQLGGKITLAKDSGCPAWVQGNAGAEGYYRVLYQGDLLPNLLKDDARVLTERETVSLIGDMAALTGNGKLPLGTAMALVPPLAHSPSRRVVSKTMEITTDFSGNLVPPDLLPQHRRYLEDLYGQRARQLGWTAKPGESEDDRLLRPQMLGVAANQAEDAELIARAKSLAQAWFDDRKVVDPDMAAALLSTAARHGDRALFDRLRAVARQEKDENIQRALFNAMGLFPQAEITNTAMSLVVTDEFDIRESLGILWAASSSPESRDLAYAFLKQNWDALIAKLPTDWGAFLPFMAGGFCDAQRRQDAASFFEGRSTKYLGGPRNLNQMLEGVDLCIAYKKAQQPSLAQFLEGYDKKN